MLKPIAIGTAICGTLDILFAMILTVAFGRQIGNMLRFVASGPFPAATEMGTAGAVLGLVVHFALMAIMVDAVRPRVARGLRCSTARRWLGLAYGLLTYFVMNWLVVPLRFRRAAAASSRLDRDAAVRAYRPRRPAHRLHRAPLSAPMT